MGNIIVESVVVVSVDIVADLIGFSEIKHSKVRKKKGNR